MQVPLQAWSVTSGDQMGPVFMPGTSTASMNPDLFGGEGGSDPSDGQTMQSAAEAGTYPTKMQLIWQKLADVLTGVQQALETAARLESQVKALQSLFEGVQHLDTQPPTTEPIERLPLSGPTRTGDTEGRAAQKQQPQIEVR
jgi:hypothetical protein